MKSQTEKLGVVNPFYERVGKEYLARAKAKENIVPVSQPEVNQQENKSVLTKDDYIFVPRLGFYVAYIPIFENRYPLRPDKLFPIDLLYILSRYIFIPY